MRRAALGAILLLAGWLRLAWIDAGWFGVDQARDLTWARSIAGEHVFPWVGPLMRGRLHLGATYYYFWSIPAFVTDDPLGFYRFAALLGVLAVGLAYRLGRDFGGPSEGLFAAALLATMPVAVIDARIAWAPAILPPLTAGVLLATLAVLRKPTRLRAALALGLASLGTQLHLAAAPLLLVTGLTVLARRRALGASGILLVTLAGVLPLAPMALAWRLDRGPQGLRGDTLADLSARADATPPARSTVAAERDTSAVQAGRVLDIALAGSRVLDGLSNPQTRPRAVDLWISIEGASVGATLLAALLVVAGTWGGRPSRRAAPSAAPPGLVVATFFVCLLAVALLPAEAWYYYLDTTLVSGAVLLALATGSSLPGRGGFRAAGRLLLLALIVARVLGIVWWIASAHEAGFVSVSLDYLRLGGPRPQGTGRARLLTIAVKQESASILAGRFALPAERLWRDTHGTGFADLDTDNGFFLARALHAAAASTRTALEPERGSQRPSALVLYRGELPGAWTAGFAEPAHAGPLDLFAYPPVLRQSKAKLVGCGGGPLPERRVGDPRDYGFGEPPYPLWPCADPVVVVPVEGLLAARPVRVFARVDGKGRVRSLASTPDGERVETDAPGVGPGVLLPPDAKEVRVAPVLDGAAVLDVYELHGATE
jgi:hypothetical protein